jgi:hypothetical protein
VAVLRARRAPHLWTWETPEGAEPVRFAGEVVEEYLASERLERPALLGSSAAAREAHR